MSVYIDDKLIDELINGSIAMMSKSDYKTLYGAIRDIDGIRWFHLNDNIPGHYIHYPAIVDSWAIVKRSKLLIKLMSSK